MELFLLEVIGNHYEVGHPWRGDNLGKLYAMVICASSEKEAREMATKESSSVDGVNWENEKYISCEGIKPNKAKVILAGYNEE